MLFFVLLLPGAALCDQGAIQRALIERDQQSAEFARKGLENLHSRQLLEASQPLPPHLRPYQRETFRQEREQAKTGTDPISGPEKGSVPDYRPLPLPGRPRPIVDPIPAPSLGG
jgi:hypothetical protein